MKLSWRAAVVLPPVLLLELAGTATCQQAPIHPLVLTSPQVNLPLNSDVSRPLRDVATEESSPQIGFHEASPVMYPHRQQLTERARPAEEFRDSALQASGGTQLSATLGLNLLGVGSGFPGYWVPDAPPDVNLAVGDTQVVQWVNVSYAVFDKTTGAVIAGPIAGNAFWSGFGGACQNNNSGDVLPQWDKLAHRWVMSQNVFSSPYATCIAISTTADATGTYYRYQFPQPGFPDYPKLGIWPDAYYESQNNFGANANVWEGPYVCAYDRTKMLTGASNPQQICFQTGQFDSSLLPSDLDSVNTPPPTGAPNVFLGSIDESNSNVYEYLFHVDFATPSNSTFTGTNGSMPVAVASYSPACGGFGSCVPQQGITDVLDSLADRLMYRLAYRNFGDHQAWLVSHSVTAGNSTGVRWYEFRAPETSTTLSVYQQGTFAPDSKYRWMGSVAMDQAQDIALGYTVSSSSMYPSISYTGRVATDPLGTMESEASIISGSGSQPGTGNRWGDYYSMVIDGADDCTFWFTAEYYNTTASFDWSTRVASIKFPNCSSGPDFTIAASPAVLSVGQGNQGTATITTAAIKGFSNSIGFSASGAPVGVSVSFAPTTIASPGNGTSTMTVSATSSTLAGSYPILINAVGGSTQHNAALTLTVTAPPSFNITATPSSLNVLQGSTATSMIATTAGSGFSHAITLSASGLPAGVSASFSPSSIAAPGSGRSTVTFTASAAATAGTYTITVTGNGGTAQYSTTVSLTVAVPPNFTLAVSPTSLTVQQGNSGTSTVTTTLLNGFNHAVNLSATGLPSGVTASFNPSSIAAPGSGTSTLTLSVSSAAAAGNYTINIIGNGGSSSLQHSATVALTVTLAPNFTLAASPSSVSVQQGNSGNATITSSSVAGFNHAVSLSASGLPSGVTARFNPSTIAAPGSGTAILTLSAATTTPTGTFTITITGNGGTVQHTSTLSMTVTPAPNFTLKTSPAVLTVLQGNSGSATISSTVIGGFNQSVSLSASGLPTGITASFTPSTIAAPGSGSATLTLSASSTATTGSYTITITGSGNSVQHTATLTLTVAIPPNFNLTASPSALTVLEGSSGSSMIATAPVAGFNHAIVLSASGLPTGVTASFSTIAIGAPGSGHATLTFNVAWTAPAGTYSITVTANGGTVQHTVTIALTVAVPNTFTWTVSPTSFTILQGNQGASAIATTALGSFTSPIALSAAGVPAGVTASFSSASIGSPGSGASTFTFTVGNSALSGTYTVTVTASGGGVTRSQAISLIVVAPDFSLTTSPTSRTASRGSLPTYTVILGALNGFSSGVTLSVGNCPAGVTCSFSPSSVTPSGTTTLTVATTTQARAATYNLVITGSSGGVQHSSTVQLTLR